MGDAPESRSPTEEAAQPLTGLDSMLEFSESAGAPADRDEQTSPSDAMWAGVEDAKNASVHGGWEDLDAAAQPRGNEETGPQELGEGRESALTEMSTPAPQGGGLRLDVGAWEKSMGDMISHIGVDRPEPLAPLADRLADTKNRLRILEEDRDVLSAQAVRLQSMLDSEREDRHIAQKAQQEAIDKLREVHHQDADVQSRDASRIEELEVTANALRQKLDKARRNAEAPAADVLDALRKRTQYLEDCSAQKEREHLQWQRDMGKKLAITLKVLQLQKEHASKVEEVQDKLHRYISQAAAEASNARNRTHEKQELIAALFRRAELIYTEETRRQREVSQVRGQAEALLRKAREKNLKLREYEGGLEEDLKTSEYERRLHASLMQEYEMEADPRGAADMPASVVGAIGAHWNNMGR